MNLMSRANGISRKQVYFLLAVILDLSSFLFIFIWLFTDSPPYLVLAGIQLLVSAPIFIAALMYKEEEDS